MYRVFSEVLHVIYLAQCLPPFSEKPVEQFREDILGYAWSSLKSTLPGTGLQGLCHKNQALSKRKVRASHMFTPDRQFLAVLYLCLAVRKCQTVHVKQNHAKGADYESCNQFKHTITKCTP